MMLVGDADVECVNYLGHPFSIGGIRTSLSIDLYLVLEGS